MAIPITIPRLGWNMEEGIFVGWLKPDGATVRPGDGLFSLESEKATEDIECLDAGILSIPADGPKPGDRVAVGTVIGHVVDQGETAPDLALPRVAAPTAVAAPIAVAVTRTREAPAASPRARRVAGELGVDWKTLTGSGQGGRIRERDVRAAAPKAAPVQRVAAGTVRRVIAERMVASHQQTAPVTLTTTCDATNLVNLRQQFKTTAAEVIPSYTDILAKLTAGVLPQHPALNAAWIDDAVVPHDEVHIGIAVDTDAGLLVPVVRDVPTLGLRALAAQTRDLIERARQRRLSGAELRDGTFTITSLGSFDIDAFTPIIQQPQCAILGVGRIQRQAVVVGDAIVPRDVLTLSLTFDHRIVDGAPAARFLQDLCRRIENPAPWLTT